MSNNVDACGKCPFVHVPPDRITAAARCKAPSSAPGKQRPIIYGLYSRHEDCPMVGVTLRWPHEPGAEAGAS